MKGYIVSKPLKSNEIWAGTQAVLVEGDNHKGVVTAMHLLPSGDWFVNSAFYNGPVDSKQSLHTLWITDENDDYYPLVIKQWNSACQLDQVNSGIEIEFEKRIYEFKEGLYQKACKACESYFMGDKRQSLCQACCDDRIEALIISALPKSQTKTKSVSYQENKEISRIAFEAARENPNQDFENWFTTIH